MLGEKNSVFDHRIFKFIWRGSYFEIITIMLSDDYSCKEMLLHRKFLCGTIIYIKCPFCVQKLNGLYLSYSIPVYVLCCILQESKS